MFCVIPALNFDVTPRALNKLLGHKQACASAHGTAGRKECIEYLR